MMTRVELGELPAFLATLGRREELSPLFGVAYLLVDNTSRPSNDAQVAAIGLHPPPCPVVLAPGESPPPARFDRLIDISPENEEELQLVVSGIEANPHAAAILVQLLRLNAHVSVAEGLFAESLAYSSLQHGGAFESWLATRERQSGPPAEAQPLVLLDRSGDRVTITLNRPGKRNAYSAALRDELYQALMLVAADSTIERAVVTGAGEGFCAGGDLGEFGEARDAAAAHLARMTASTAALLDRLSERVAFRLHGACIGAGIELPAFSRDVAAAPDSFFQLPEVAMGLIPGAGGTVSITRRIGRQRMAYMAVSGARIDAGQALAWGLIDRIE